MGSGFNNKAPKGCLQYFFGTERGVITSLNWNSGSGRAMNERNKSICIRREANRSSMEYHQAGGTEIAKVSCRAVPGTGTNPFNIHIVCGILLPNYDEADEFALPGFVIGYVQT